MSRGSALVESLVVGIVVTLGISQLTLAATALTLAGDEAEDIAAAAAEWGARHADHRFAVRLAELRAPEGSTVTAERRDDRIVVTVTIPVNVPGPAGLVVRTATGRASAVVAPYRSNRE